MKINYGLVAVLKIDMDKVTENKNHTWEHLGNNLSMLDIKHFCGFEQEPDIMSYVDLYHELRHDPEFELGDNEFIIIPASDAIIDDCLPNREVDDEKGPEQLDLFT